ncbi:HeH/LEM domain-containing protein [Acinetobacter johnsonii]|uniref:HeH/LEM domain-containing protein n=1 Tax=Acinetobacter johnsonii TaxID=40214 RepID=UPI00244BBDEE|nr:HeH/LEM domain-containing protein [Acinetobacter johnsonii]MDH1406199.1 HeH/LEM domain-containing protein [Acinetobacter johnsonii]
MAIGKGEKKTRWEDVVAGFKVQQPEKTSGKASGSSTGSKAKGDDAGKNGGGTEGAGDSTQPTDFNALTVEKLKEQLVAKGIEIPADAKKADLVALLEQE